MKEMFFSIVKTFEILSQRSVEGDAAHWLNIAYKLDYIPLSQKERIDSLLAKGHELFDLRIHHEVTAKDVEDMREIVEIAENTRFTSIQLLCET